MAALRELRDKPAGTVRITAIDHVVDTVLWPRLAPVLLQYPDIKIEVHADYRMVDIVAERYDIGVRFGDQVAKDMIAVRVSPDVQMTIVGSPAISRTVRCPQTPATWPITMHHPALGHRGGCTPGSSRRAATRCRPVSTARSRSMACTR